MTLLIANKCNINITCVLGSTPLIVAAHSNEMTTVRALVEAGADTTIRNKQKMTAAQTAAERDCCDVTEYLNHTIRFCSSACDGKGKLHCLKGRSLRAIERDLIENGLFVNHVQQRLLQFSVGQW